MNSVDNPIATKNAVVHMLNQEYKGDIAGGNISQPKTTARNYAEQKTDATGLPGTSNSTKEQSNKPNTPGKKSNTLMLAVGLLIAGVLLYLILKK